MELAKIRKDYNETSLDESQVPTDNSPFPLFATWMTDAIAAKALEPKSMCLTTVDERGRPSARMVICTEYSTEGFCFFSLKDSKKGLHLEQNPNVALTFWWAELERSVRVEGSCKLMSDSEIEHYF